MDKNKQIVEWFKTHNLFSVHGMCKLIKLDAGNFSRYISCGKIPEKHFDKIEKIIKKYGYESKLP